MAENSIAKAMLEEFESEVRTTRKFLERVPEEKLDWRPHEKSMTAGQLALHLASIPYGVLQMALSDRSSPPNFGKGREEPATVAQVLETLDRSAAFVRETLPTIDDDRMRAKVEFVQGERTLWTPSRMTFLRNILLNHWYHHRGQLGVYLRLLGTVVPSSYGPSGDEPPAFSSS
jgi:uncharacterized damage-inducible protein DinB